MKKLLLVLSVIFYQSMAAATQTDLLTRYASEVPTEQINKEITKYLSNEIGYKGVFQKDYSLAEYVESSTGNKWYILDGYFKLDDGTILFLDFDYSPINQSWKPINNYSFVPEENKRFLLKAEEICNPYRRHYIGTIVFEFKEAGHLDEMMSYLKKELGLYPVLYSYGSVHVIQDLTAAFYKTPLFTLQEEKLINKMNALDFIKGAMLIPSGRNPSNEEVSQRYVSVTENCIIKN